MARYIDSGSRHVQDALGTWFEKELMGAKKPTGLRIQSGYFAAASLGFLESTLAALEQSNGLARILVGSNDGQTPRLDIAQLLAIAGQPRSNLRVGVVSFQAGLFHPKVYHFERADGSSTAYVGSANLTGQGTRSLNVEAGLILDSGAGDSVSTLDEIADAIDDWFTGNRPGFYPVAGDADLDPLVQARVIGVTPPPRVRRTVGSTTPSPSSSAPRRGHSLRHLLAAPPINKNLPGGAALPASGGTSAPTGGATGKPVRSTGVPSKASAVKHWGKKLSDSDAQRKKTGNQRGAITLVQGDYRGQIDQTTYFRNDLFASQPWQPGVANTGKPIERAAVPMHVTIDGISHGVMEFEVTNGTNRESGQNNYTAEIHIEPIGALIRKNNISGKHLDVALDVNGEYWLTIS